MKKNLILILIVIIVITALVVADYLKWLYIKSYGIHPYVAYVYLLALLFLIIYAVVIPFWRIFTAPPVPSLRLNDLPAAKEDLYQYGLLLAKNNDYIRSKEERKKHRKEFLKLLELSKDSAEELQKSLIKEIHKRTQLINYKIKQQALSVFLITGFSQNGKFDFIANFLINFRLIHQVIRLSGFRPTYGQISRLYIEVILASFITDVSEEMLDDIDFSSVFDKINLPVIFVKSFIDGSMSAIMTLRIGYITKSYILHGTRELKKMQGNKKFRSKIRHEAIVSSLKAYPSLAKDAGSKIRKSSFNFLGSYMKKLFFGFGKKDKEE
ncbi:MAG: hypothetical protein LIO93_02035 [Bacteroidales bacterium]|nr:hypothetical protein [Bacteroidales bacterium]